MSSLLIFLRWVTADSLILSTAMAVSSLISDFYPSVLTPCHPFHIQAGEINRPSWNLGIRPWSNGGL
jgi:hypothetical protein